MAHARWIAPTLLALGAALPAADLTTVLKVGATDDGLPTGPGATISYQWFVTKPPGSGTVGFTARTLTSADISAGYTNSATASLYGAVAGTYTFYVVATDRGGLSATSSNVVVTVYSQNPTISDILAQTATASVQKTVAFTISDRDSNANAAESSIPNTLSATPGFTVTSTNTAVTGSSFSITGSGGSRNVVFTPPVTASGSATITVTVRDANGRSASDSFPVTVAASLPEIAVDLNGTDIVNGSTPTAIAGTQPGTATTIHYRIRNTGSANLTLGAFSIGTQTNCTATVLTQPVATLAAGASATLSVQVTPTAVGAWSFPISSGTTNDSDENPFNFTVTGTANTYQLGSISRHVWSGITGTTVVSLTGNAAYPNSPTSTGSLTSFEAPTNAGDNYGQRVFGLLVPATSGTYQFAIASDDASDLYLGTTADPATKTRIAYHTQWTNSREFTKYTTQTSATVALVAGQAYFIEAIMKEGSGGDNLAVAWTGPGYASMTVIPGSVLAPLPTSAPEIAVDRSGSDVPNNSLSAISNTKIGIATPVAYVVRNTGTSPLTLGAFATGTAVNATVTNLTQTSTTLAAGASATLSFLLTPTVAGSWSVPLSATTSDSDENPFAFTVAGTSSVNSAPVLSPIAPLTVTLGSAPLITIPVADADSTPSLQWSTVSGPSSAVFSTPNSASSYVSFSREGVYTLRLRATDGFLTSDRLATVAVNLPLSWIIDNGMAGHTTGGSWTDGGTTTGFGSTGWQQTTAPSATTAWRFNVPYAYYEASVFVPSGGTQAPQLPFRIEHGNGITLTKVSGTAVGWQRIGWYQAKTLDGLRIELSGSASGAVRADAARLIRIPGWLVDNTTGGYVQSGAGWTNLPTAGLDLQGLRYSTSVTATASWLANITGDHRVLVYRVPSAQASPIFDYILNTGTANVGFEMVGNSGATGWVDFGRYAITSTAKLTASHTDSLQLRADAVRFASDRFVNNETPGYNETGNGWSSVAGLGHDGSAIRSTSSAGTSASFRAALPGGRFQVWFYRISTPGSATNAVVTINSNPVTNTTLDLTGSTGWVNLGQYQLGSSTGEVQITRSGTSALRVDAVRFEEVGSSTGVTVVPLGGG
ncbi:MAG: hypothetical protein RLZZ127_477 [Planctomycetota bacterium]|jgi:hypothetical protein